MTNYARGGVVFTFPRGKTLGESRLSPCNLPPPPPLLPPHPLQPTHFAHPPATDVVAGQPRPLMRSPMLCPEIHGDSGLDGPAGGRLLPRSGRQPRPGACERARARVCGRACAYARARGFTWEARVCMC